MNMFRTLTFAAGIAIAVSTSAWAQKDAALGHWKLNVAKSSIKSGAPPKEATLMFGQAGKGVKSVQEVTGADGKKSTVSYTAEYNGRDYPVTGSATADTIALKFGDGNTVQRVDKKGGKIVMTWSRTISRDGKVMTVLQKGTGPDGKPVDNTWIFEKAS